MEAKLKHLEMIQAVITRMAGNSFQLKGWSVVVISALFAFAATAVQSRMLVLVAFFPALAFWMLDGYFLRQERLFRKLYDAVRVLPSKRINFSMDTRPYEAKVASWFSVAFSCTLFPFHGSVVALISVGSLLLICGKG